jgi:hypothetical protein
MKWLAWENVGVDRMACAWLIRRFIDPQAEFQFIPAGQKPIQNDAEPFDIPGVKYSHRRGHCTFVTFLKEHNLKDPILQQIGHIVDEADVVQEVNLEPVSPGLDLICRGLRRISPGDQEAIERGCLIYDALYAELSQTNLSF